MKYQIANKTVYYITVLHQVYFRNNYLYNFYCQWSNATKQKGKLVKWTWKCYIILQKPTNRVHLFIQTKRLFHKYILKTNENFWEEKIFQEIEVLRFCLAWTRKSVIYKTFYYVKYKNIYLVWSVSRVIYLSCTKQFISFCLIYLKV